MSEDMIWQILDKQFCSFKTVIEGKAFCKNEYNLTGMCNKMYCPLANGRYATIREEDGVLYLHVKTIERAHSPANLWEKIPLPDDMAGALSIINDNLAFWPRRFVNKVKERLVRLHQYLIRYRKWYYRAKPRLVTVHKKFERREQRRELKALIAAKLDVAIKQELLERLKQGTYEFINLKNPQYQELLREEKRREQKATRGKRQKQEGPPEKDQQEEKEGELSAKSIKVDFNSVSKNGKTVQFTADDDDEDTLGDMEDLEDVDEEDEEEEEEEGELELELEDGDSELRKDILKHIAISLDKEEGDDREMSRLKKMLLQTRKRKLEHKHEKERKQTQDAQKKQKHYGPHVEIEYEPSTSTTTNQTSW